MKKRLSWLWFLFCLPSLVGFTPYFEGQRLYVGKDRLVDWVDVGCLFTVDSYGKCCIECWCDESDIQSISIDLDTQLALQHYRVYKVTKANSVWSLTFFSPDPGDIGITLRNPSKIAQRCQAK